MPPVRTTLYGFHGPADPAAQTTQEADLLEKMLGQLQVPEPTPPPKLSKRDAILGSLADVLRARAQVMAGGQPQPGRFATEQKANADKFAAEMELFRQREADMNNEIAKLKYQIAAGRQAKLEEDLALRQRKEYEAGLQVQAGAAKAGIEDALIRGRQAEDDERDASIELNKWKRDKFLELSKAAGEVGMPDIIPNVDPSTLSVNDIANLQIDIAAKLTGQVVDDTGRLKAQQAIVKEAFPGLIPTGVDFNSKGEPNAKFGVDPMGTISQADRRLAIQTGIQSYNEDGTTKTPQQLTAEIADVKKKALELQEEERRTRLNQVVKGSKAKNATIGMKLASTQTLIQNAEIALSLLQARGTGSPGGPLSGHLPHWIVNLNPMYTKDNIENRREVQIRLQNIFNVDAKERSGAAVSLPEEIRLRPELPLFTDLKADQVRKLKVLIEMESRFLNNVKKQFGITDDDLDFIGRSVAGTEHIESSTETGDILLLGGGN